MAILGPLPSFFRQASPLDAYGSYSGVIRHDIPSLKADAHARWWPGGSSTLRLQTVILFIPGNPGLLDFYLPFLSALHRSSRDKGLAILAHAHPGHTPHLNLEKPIGLLHQVDATLDIFDTIRQRWSGAKIVLIGHSVGSWIAMQVLKARPHTVDALFFLFPTISQIVRTPNGRRLSWLFHSPVASLVSRLSILIRPITAPVLSLLFPSWPAHQRAVLRSLVRSPRSIYASLTMAHDEMRTITELDVSLLKEHSAKLWFYYAEKDNWVGNERENVVRSLDSDPAAVRVVHCKHGVPHAFCILHGDIIAAQCTEWLRQGELVGECNNG